MFFLLLIGLLSWNFLFFEPPKPTMSKAGVLTHPSCSKYSEQIAVAMCEHQYPIFVKSQENDNISINE